ncbi:matE domain-containing protein [Hirsutella rhossiliensis]|uniref:MatE domain-containing protein n=1 Tax=Hirsutella rhossiliensis TaxID=111463 RepID=A0A9P8SLC2_9HYPO|nr:matE domain-containing protein [Hirsutella rhossiliensis]KAH0965660.1 matE domain-containing protein [Hirsutella rhossiliensis]
MDRGRPILSPKIGADSRSNSGTRRMLSSSPLAEQALADDIAACSEDGNLEASDDEFLDQDLPPIGHGMYRRPSGVAYGTSRPVFSQQIDEPILTPLERKQSRDAERSLLRDNRVLPPKHQDQEMGRSLRSRIYRRLFSTRLPPRDDDEGPIVSRQPTERSPLLNGVHPDSASGSGDDLEEQWEEAVASGRLRTTWQRETKTVVAYSAPLIGTFFLQYSINVASIFAVGRIGKVELGAVSLANMSAAVSCLAPFQGLATSLDTLCAQAYGSGHKHLVGLQCQRMAAFLLCISAPVVVLWLFSERILVYIVPDPESARLAGLYLRVMIFAIPGIILFETGKRFLQAQGLFRATTYVLLVAAPVNIFTNWLLVWKLDWGFVGAPIAIVITENLLPVLLVLYVRLFGGSQCWGGFSKRAFANWWVMIRLALPGMIMVEAEWLAFEVMTLLASRFGTEYLAAQSVLATLSTISYQIPFPVSIAASTRIANLIGAGMVDAAKTTARVTVAAVCILGLLNLTIFSTLRFYLPLLFTNDQGVIELVAQVLPLVAVMQVLDGLSAGAHGLLRGIGKQSIGGPANLISYYVISLPISLALAFAADWKLEGMWAGVTVGLIVVSIIEYTYLLRTDWHKAAAEAAARNAAG